MDKIIFFSTDPETNDTYCRGQKYREFIDHAFSKFDHFMLVYINYGGRGYKKSKKYFKKKLEPFKAYSRSDPMWPAYYSSSELDDPDSTFKIVFYRTDPAAKDILKEVDSLSDWSRYGNPEDLAFYKNGQCRFFSDAHERTACFLHADMEDIDFLISNGLAGAENIKEYDPEKYDHCDEPES